MTITRIGIVPGDDGLPVISKAVIRGDTVYLCGVWLADMSLFEAHNAAWNAWVDRANPPARACVGAPLYRPGMLVEIMVTAAR
jgi:enamine deaminase RidA (YjgF/YER057c/UK114 family)